MVRTAFLLGYCQRLTAGHNMYEISFEWGSGIGIALPPVFCVIPRSNLLGSKLIWSFLYIYGLRK
jgi:hypothetical protein